MKAYGNGTPETCASNLLRMVRGEVPYDRMRGRDGSLIDQANVTNKAAADVRWLLETYEPRVEIESIDSISDAALTGDFAALVNIKRKEAEEK